jgi:class 3 adenylate cyclase/predicted ATPase
MDLGSWLRSLGLAQYEAVLLENEIDADVLHDLTEDHLREIGLPLGARLKLLKAIRTLASRTESIGRTPSVEAAERRQVTVMFSDLVGSTALSTRMDPEDLREVISAYQKCVAEIVQRFDGFVARYMGDGVLVYFGYPQAHEDNPEWAVRAGLELITAVTALESRALLRTRVGIATGLVVVGDLVGSGYTQEHSIVGKTPNLAARLQEVAEPNTVVICDSTRKILGNLFELQDLGPRDFKGIGEPVRAWAVLRPSSAESRFEALHALGMTALVGREKERAMLLRCWSKATKGQGQLVLLSGEAGVGKSRLTAAIIELLRAEPHTCLRYFCSPQHTNSPLHPIIGHLQRAAGLARDDSLQGKLGKLDDLLMRTATSKEDMALIADMLSLPNDGRYPVLDELTPQQRRQRTLEALVAQMQSLARQNAVLLVLEDAHWTDPTTLELFGRIIERIKTLRVLLIVTFRPEFEPSWLAEVQVTALTLNRLAPREVDVMIGHIVGNKPLPTSIRQDIIERTDGIPLFVEEMTKAVLEAESEGEARRTVALVPSPALAVPASLHASLMARLDRLGPAKELAQIGAALGREFSCPLLAAVMRKPEAELLTAIRPLVSAGLLLGQTGTQQAIYSFKHALVRDAAYSTLLREPRRALHARIVETLETHFADIAENQPELLARHCTEAGQIEKAAGLWGKAGLRSAQRSALIEAKEQLGHALNQIATLIATPDLRREEIKLQVALITPLLHTSGYAAPETRTAVERARLLIERATALGESPEDPLLLFSVLYGFWVANLVAFNGDVMRDFAGQFLTLANQQSATGPRMMAHRLMGLSLLHTGDIAEGQVHLDRAITLYDPTQHRPLATRFGQDVGAATLCWKSLGYWLLGYPQAALTDSEDALKVAREIGHSATLMYALNFSAWTQILCGNSSATKALGDQFSALKDQIGSLFWSAWEMMLRGCLQVMTGKTSDAVQTMTSGVAAMRSTGTTMWMPYWLSRLGAAHAEVGQLADARRCIDEAMIAMETANERWCEAEVNRIAGVIAALSLQPDVTAAEAHFERALAIARQQHAKSWELRAAMSKARLWRDQGRGSQARELLAPVYDWFTEGLDTLDLREAKALLNTLAS